MQTKFNQRRSAAAREKVFGCLSADIKTTSAIIQKSGLCHATVLKHLRVMEKQGLVTESLFKGGHSGWNLGAKVLPVFSPEDQVLRHLSNHVPISITEMAGAIGHSYSGTRTWIHTLCREGNAVEIIKPGRYGNGWMRPFREELPNPLEEIQARLAKFKPKEIIQPLPWANLNGYPVADVVAALSNSFIQIPNYKEGFTAWMSH